MPLVLWLYLIPTALALLALAVVLLVFGGPSKMLAVAHQGAVAEAYRNGEPQPEPPDTTPRAVVVLSLAGIFLWPLLTLVAALFAAIRKAAGK